MNQMPSVPWGVPLHCDLRPLKTPTGIIRLLLVVSYENDLIVWEFNILFLSFLNRYHRLHVFHVNFQPVQFKWVYSFCH